MLQTSFESKTTILYFVVFTYFSDSFFSFSHKYKFEFVHWKLFLSRKQMRDDIICMLTHTFITTSTFHFASSPVKHNILVVAHLRLHERLLEEQIFQHFFHIYESTKIKENIFPKTYTCDGLSQLEFSHVAFEIENI